MSTFAELVASRKAWIENELRPWCARASRKDLRLAEQEWLDIAGKVDPEKTLWFWAWSRFPDLVNANLMAIDEARQVTVTLADGRSINGFPDARQSKQGQLVLLCRSADRSHGYSEEGPFSLDDIVAITPVN